MEDEERCSMRCAVCGYEEPIHVSDQENNPLAIPHAFDPAIPVSKARDLYEWALEGWSFADDYFKWRRMYEEKRAAFEAILNGGAE